MNCHELNSVVNDLARDQMMDASLREKALSHAASCAACATRLADERALTAGFRFVANMANEEAPARVETALLEAFRRQRASVPTIAPARPARQRWLYVAAGVAAAVLIVAVLAFVAYKNSEKSGLEKAINPGPASSPAVPDEARRPSPEQQASPESADQKTLGVHAPGQRRSADRIRNAGRSKRPVEAINRPASDAEIATDFIPLMNRETLAQMDGGQVMRVELPRSALMSFGLPMDMERAGERIKADVVVGNDGLARAIRFVR